ncbi:MAG: hypothetical protein Q8S41_14000 [Lutibacter sp.]|nr:hypothetical protein [Lutibacter sp.]
MDILFSNATNNPEQFFNILPNDWQYLIVPYWESYKDVAKIYVLKENEEVVAGGLVFSKSLPDMSDFERSLQYLFKEGYLYIGFIWVPLEKRNRNFASQWLTLLKNQDPNQKYWLTIEEEWLKHFYEKNGFKLMKESDGADNKEWLFTWRPKSEVGRPKTGG